MRADHFYTYASDMPSAPHDRQSPATAVTMRSARTAPNAALAPSPVESHIALLPRAVAAQNLPGHVHAALFEAILNGVLAPGERLLVDDLAQHFGVSKIPVREALKTLEADGWVEIRPRRGTFVRPLLQSELDQAFELRRLVEPYCARLAAHRRSDQQVQELARWVQEGMQAIKSGDIARTDEANHQFHAIVARAAGNSMIEDVVAKLEFKMRRYFMDVPWTRRRITIAQHRAIFEAIRDQDAEQAGRLTLAHLKHTEDSALAKVVPDQGR